MKEGSHSVSFDLPAQITDVHVNQITFRVEPETPHSLQDHAACQHTAGIAQEIFEQRELSRCEDDPLPCPFDLARNGIQHEIGQPKRRFAYGCRPPQERPHAGAQLFRGQGLSDHVVSTRIQRGDPGVDAVMVNDHDQRSLDCPLAERLQEPESVASSVSAVEHDQVVTRGLEHELERRATVRRDRHGIAVLLKRARDYQGRRLRISDHQYARRREWSLLGQRPTTDLRGRSRRAPSFLPPLNSYGLHRRCHGLSFSKSWGDDAAHHSPFPSATFVNDTLRQFHLKLSLRATPGALREPSQRNPKDLNWRPATSRQAERKLLSSNQKRLPRRGADSTDALMRTVAKHSSDSSALRATDAPHRAPRWPYG